MVNEMTLMFETELPIPFTCADGAGIEKGSLLQIADLMTASVHTAADQAIAGVAAEEKISGDGKVKIAVYRRGIFKAKLSGSATVGEPLSGDSMLNHIKQAPLRMSGSKVCGVILETGTTGETVLWELNAGIGGAPAAT